MASITLDWTTFALEIVNFLVLLWLLKRFLYRPLADVLARRRAQIEQALAEGRAARTGAEALQKQYQGRIADWEREKAQARVALGEELERERARRMGDLAAALERERQRRESAAAREADQRRREAERAALEQGAAFAARLTGALAGPELEARIIDLALAEVGALANDKLEALRLTTQGAHCATVRSAYPVDEARRARLAAALREAAAAPLELVFAAEPALVAGVRIELGAWVLAANIRDELAAFADSGRERH